MPNLIGGIQADSGRFGLLYRLTSDFNSSLDIEEVLNRVMDCIIAATRAERGFVMLRDPDGEFTFRVARGLDQQTILDPRSEVSLGVVRKVISEGAPVLTSDAQDDARFSARSSIINLRLRSILCVPLSLKGQTFGVVYVDNRMQSGIFTQANLELLSAIASNAAIAIENARLYQVAVEKGRLERELQIAYQLQVSLLPKEIPQPSGWDFSAYWRPAHYVAGDYYDFIPLGDHHLGLVIADVADKGIPASLFMAISRTILRARAREVASPLEIITSANRLVCTESTSGYFITLFFAQLDLRSGELMYVNAGHPPPLLFRQDEQQHLTPLNRTGIPLGIDETAAYEQHRVTIDPGGFVFCYTDGITEAINDREQEFGFDRLLSAIIENCSPKNTADFITQKVQSYVSDWVGNSEPFDDITILMAKRL